MAQYTQKAIMHTFQQMLEEMPFDKITVTALVRRTEVSSNTFYYHFQDIYELLDRWLHEELSQYLIGCESGEDLKATSKILLRNCKAHANVIYHICHSLSREHMERYIFSLTDDIFYQQVFADAAPYGVPEEIIRETADFCRYAFVGFFLKFLWNQMDDDTDRAVDRLGTLFDGFVAQVIVQHGQNLFSGNSGELRTSEPDK